MLAALLFTSILAAVLVVVVGGVLEISQRGTSAQVDATGLQWRVEHVPQWSWGVATAIFVGSAVFSWPWAVQLGWIFSQIGVAPLQVLGLLAVACTPLLAFVPIVRKPRVSTVTADARGITLAPSWPHRRIELAWSDIVKLGVVDGNLSIETSRSKRFVVQPAVRGREELGHVADLLHEAWAKHLRSPRVAVKPPPRALTQLASEACGRV